MYDIETVWDKNVLLYEWAVQSMNASRDLIDL